MVTNNTYEYGIKYRALKLENGNYLLFPISLEGGLSDGFEFSTGDDTIQIANYKKDLKKKYVMDKVFTTEELEEIYEYDENTDFLAQVFFDDFKDVLIYAEVDKENDDILRKYEINLNNFQEHEYDLTYVMDKGSPAIVLNEDAFNDLLSSDDIGEIKVLLNKYKKLAESFEEFSNSTGVTKVNIVDGKVDSFETIKKVDKASQEKKEEVDLNKDITYNGLRNAIKEKVFGHDEVIDTFAQKLYLNYTAQKGETVESILLVGPTGTGKTETVRAACEYLGVPWVSVNASNIVPQGIKGMSLEDVIVSLFEMAECDLAKAERGLVFFDEFDKLNDSDLEIKGSVKNIFLTFTEGGTFPIDNDNYSFVYNSYMTMKLFAGVFERIFEKLKKPIGFGTNNDNSQLFKEEEEIRKKIIDKGYFSLEELSRIPLILLYNEIDRDTKKRILLYSKLSELAKDKKRYKRQFDVDLVVSDDFIDGILDKISNSETGMRSLNNLVKRSINIAERSLLENEGKGYKKLVLSKNTIENPNNFNLEK